jgi:hypothetical protein
VERDAVRRVLREQTAVLHRRVLAIVRDDEVCRRMMTIPGVGLVVADLPRHRRCVGVFRNFREVGALDPNRPIREADIQAFVALAENERQQSLCPRSSDRNSGKIKLARDFDFYQQLPFEFYDEHQCACVQDCFIEVEFLDGAIISPPPHPFHFRRKIPFIWIALVTARNQDYAKPTRG